MKLSGDLYAPPCKIDIGLRLKNLPERSLKTLSLLFRWTSRHSTYPISLNLWYNHFLVREIDVRSSWIPLLRLIRKIACHSTRMIQCLAGWVTFSCYPFQMQGCWHSSLVDALIHLLKGCVNFVSVSSWFRCWNRCFFWILNRCNARSLRGTDPQTLSDWS